MKRLAALLALAALTGCAHAQPAAVAPGQAATGMQALAKARDAAGAMPRAQAEAFVKAIDANGDGQLASEEGRMYLSWGTTLAEMVTNYPDIFDPNKPYKPIPAALFIEKMTAGGKADFMIAASVGVKDQHLVPMPKAQIRRLADAMAKALAMGPDVQRGKLPVRHVINRHFLFRPGKDVLRHESERWVAGTIADIMADPNPGVKIEAAGRHADGPYQFYFYEHKVFD